MKSGSLDDWRNYFRTANSDIFDIIDHAIMVAATDCPKELKLRRDRIAERLFSCRLTKCSGCERVELAIPSDDVEEDDEERVCKSGFDRDGVEFEAGASKESKVNDSRDDQGEMNMNHVSNYSYGDAEALTDEIEEENQIVGEVLRIKEVLLAREEESESVLFESLRRLQLMDLTVHTLKATKIGKAVNGLRKHGSEQIRQLACILIDLWKVLVDEWVNTMAAIPSTEGTPDSKNPSVVDDEEGLPSPPLDEGFLFSSQPTAMELSDFFDGMDDDGNPRTGGESLKNREKGRKPALEDRNITKVKQQSSNEVALVAKEKKNQQVNKQKSVVKPNKPSSSISGPGRPPRQNMEQRIKNEVKIKQKSDNGTIQRRLPIGMQNKSKCLDEDADKMKLEATKRKLQERDADKMKLETTKRKLQERYQQAEEAKKQRTIQVMELHDLPKQGLVQRNPNVKPGNHNRNWAHGWR